MRRVALTFALAALAAVVAPPTVAGAQNPVCKAANAVGQKFLGEDVMYCIDDPNGPY